jgi:hypothetical protein
MTNDRMASILAMHEGLERVFNQIALEDFLSNASQTMEIYEMFDRAVAKGESYGQGYQDGFWAGRELDAKYQQARLESMTERISNL